MQNETPQGAATAPPSQAITPAEKLIAPVWHTVLVVVVLLTFSFLGASGQEKVVHSGSRILLYSGTFLFELVLVLVIWWGMSRSGTSMRSLIGGRWDTVEAFLLDLAMAIGFLVAANIILLGVRLALGTIDLHHPDKQLEETKRMLGPLIPRTRLDAAAFVLLSVFAGLFEELIFRGYLQRQLGAIGRNAYVGILASAVVFGASHAYQGGRMMVVIGVYGALFGLLAYFRGSLRPGMMAHAMQDAAAGLALFYFAR